MHLIQCKNAPALFRLSTSILNTTHPSLTVTSSHLGMEAIMQVAQRVDMPLHSSCIRS